MVWVTMRMTFAASRWHRKHLDLARAIARTMPKMESFSLWQRLIHSCWCQRGKYSTAALIYLTVSHASILDFYTEATNKVKKDNPNLKIEHWLQFDTDQHDDSKPTTACKANTAAGCAAYSEAKVNHANNLLGPTIQGIYFDNEGVGNNLLALTEAFAQVREKLGVKISFTKGISNASPKVLNTVFDYCPGQSYTDDTANLYAQTSCRRVTAAALWDAWNQKNPFIEGGYSVPTLCAGGNCQGDMPGFLVSRGGPCNIDERLDTTGIAEVIQSVDMEKIPNLAHFGGRPPCARWAGRDRRAVGMGFQPGRGFALPSTCLVAPPLCQAQEAQEAQEGRRDLSSVNCNTLLTDVVPCRNTKCEAVLSKWGKLGGQGNLRQERGARVRLWRSFIGVLFGKTLQCRREESVWHLWHLWWFFLLTVENLHWVLALFRYWWPNCFIPADCFPQRFRP